MTAGSDRRQLILSEEDTAFLDSIGLRWEATKDGSNPWVIVYGVPVPAGYQIGTVRSPVEVAWPASWLESLLHRAVRDRQVPQNLDGSRRRISAIALSWQVLSISS